MNIKIPVSWLREYVKTDVAAKTIANYLSLSGPSVERIKKKNSDYIFEIEVTTNRPDAFSVFGIARETYAILKNEGEKSQLIEPPGLNLNLDPDISHLLPLDVIIKNQSLCPRFSAIVIDNIKIKPSPAFIRKRLEACQVRSINNIVDISNYIMLELGQPMHTFDYDKIKSHKMILRSSREGERLKTLDEKTRKLPKDAIVIEDSQRLIDLCGIMGGANSQISTRTKRVVLFVQAYDPVAIRKTTQALAFRTEAAARFEKGIDMEGIIPALSRAVYLAKKTAGAKIASELIDIYQQKPKIPKITLNFSLLNQYLGLEIEKFKAETILRSLGFKTKLENETIIAQPPSWRMNDACEEVDLIEEIARIWGYHRLPSKLPEGQIPASKENTLVEIIELKDKIKYLGLTEVISYSIISKEFFVLSQVKKEKAVEIANPLSLEWQFMRPTILLSLVDIIAKNQNIEKDLKLFEVSKTYLKQKDNLPKQDLILAVAINNGNFYQIKGLVQNIFEATGRQEKWQDPTFQDPLFEINQSAQIKVGSEPIGTAGILNPKVNKYFKLEEPIAAAQINLTKIYSLPPQTKTYKTIPKYPPVIEDISVITDQKIHIGDIISQSKKAGAPQVKKIEIIDIFEDENIGVGKKSVTLRLTYQKSDGTPSQEEIVSIREKIIKSLQKSLEAKIRR